jgi:tetratricopeptide (TPR) repeat protein
MKITKTSNKKIPRRQLVVFKFIALLIPLMFILVFELILRLAAYGDDFSLFIPHSREGYEDYMMVNPEIGKKYFQELEYTEPANDIFLKNKDENTFRIFVMGSSTVFGFPFERNLMFSRILHRQLEDTWTEKKIEVVNTAITAINSFTLLDFTDQILRYEPDAVLIYAGHNEFYGAFGIASNEAMTRNLQLARMHLVLMDLRIYQLMRNTIAGVSKSIAAGKEKEAQGTLMKRMVDRKDIIFGSEEYNLTIKRYSQNMGTMLGKFKKENVPVFLSELVSNVAGMEPFHSIASDTLDSAIDIYRKAQAAEAKSEFEQALELYYRAKDLDCVRFRASEDINKIVQKLSEEYQATRVPMLTWFMENSPNRLIGNNLMTEHVHPNIEGNFIMAEAFYTVLVKSGLAGLNELNVSFNRQYINRNYGYTSLDSLLAHHRVQLLKGFWPFVKEGEAEKNYKLVHKPQSEMDSLAFSVLLYSNRSLSDVRLDLARSYEKRGKIFEAYREYEALLRTNPYIGVNYRDAANCLLQLSDLPRALKYFKKSLEFEESFFATFRIGEIYLLQGDYDNAIASLEKAFALAPDDRKVNVLAKSYVAFVYNRQKARAEAAASELKRVNASQYLKVPPKRYVYDDYVPFQTRNEVLKAKELMSTDRFDEALEVLLLSLEVYDSHSVKRLIGDVYYRQNLLEPALKYYSEVYDEFRFDAEFLHHLTLIYIIRQEEAEALKNIEELRKIEPEYEHLKILSLLLSKKNNG